MQVDGVYVGCPGVIAVIDHEKKHTFIVRKEGLPDIGKMIPFCCLVEQDNTIW